MNWTASEKRGQSGNQARRDRRKRLIKTFAALMMAWGLTLVPLLWGVLSTVKKAAMLFR
jgi:hypothetical protein